MSKFVEGSYLSIEEAQKAIDVLVSRGYAENDITLVTNSSVKDSISMDTDVDVTTNYDGATDNDDDKSMWDKIKDVFTVDTYDETSYDSPDYNRDDDVLYNYKEDIDNGNIIVLVDGDPNMGADNVNTTDADTLDTSSPTAVPPVIDPTPLPGEGIMPDPALTPGDNVVADPDPVPEVDPTLTDHSVDDTDKITLQEERLDVDTNEVQTGEVNIKKNVTEETKTVEVPVKHEEVTIEKRPVTGNEPADGVLGDEEEITIPITEEQIEVTKRPVVTDEVVVNKETKEETKEVSETLRKEDLDVDTQGDVTVDNDDDLKRS
ncbi:YsnF/AvaK domain-containing protein [Desemzia sp. FAM 23991]|uniref:YsnF/AvaK domain-containing protein n=1 Tax=unclassified Desemzia TaxID=2685243 RepID=UPI003887B3F6